MAISKEEWLEWKKSKATIEFLQHCIGTREEYAEEILEGRVVEPQEQNVRIGRCQGIKDMVSFALSWNGKFNPSVEDIEDGKTSSISGGGSTGPYQD